MSKQFTLQAEASLPTAWGDIRILAFANDSESYAPHLALVRDYKPDKAVNVRLHSECLTGDILHSKRCDCGEQLQMALEYIAQNGGVLIYLRQEGRGIGLINKLRAYNLQDKGLNTVEANVHLGFEPDERSYEIAIEILNQMSIARVNLITNNPEKIRAFEGSGIALEKRIPIEVIPGEENEEYLDDKRKLMGHLLKHKNI